MVVTGKVSRRLFAAGSKSEHMAVVLRSEHGDYVLRRPGGNPFSDPILEQLIGKDIEADGEVQGYNLMLKDWQEV